MKQFVYTLCLVTGLCLTTGKVSGIKPVDGTIQVNGKQMAYQSGGLENRKAGEPVVVFECGFGSGDGSYMPLLFSLPSEMPVFTYDRNGLGDSEIDTTLISDADVVNRLHNLLTTLRIEPPYILIGHSLGGPFVRLFTSIYPDEVSGLMLIDPTDYMLTAAEDEQVKTLTDSRTGYRQLMPIMFGDILADEATPAGMRQETSRVKRNMETNFFGEYQSLPPLRNIPSYVLIAYNRRTEEAELELSLKNGIQLKPWFAELDWLRIRHYGQLIENNDHSSVILLPQYSHGIHHQDPQLVAGYVEKLYQAVISVGKK